MKQEIPTPVAIGLIVVVLAVLGFFVYRWMSDPPQRLARARYPDSAVRVRWRRRPARRLPRRKARTPRPISLPQATARLADANTNRHARLHEKRRSFTPSLRFPLRAGGTKHAPCVVPLAKRGEPVGGGQM
jgi:hypothetical protein